MTIHVSDVDVQVKAAKLLWFVTKGLNVEFVADKVLVAGRRHTLTN